MYVYISLAMPAHQPLPGIITITSLLHTCTVYIIIVFYCGEADLIAPEFGQLIVDSTLFGSVASYICDSGYALVGDAKRTCTLLGWSGNHPVCCKCLYQQSAVCMPQGLPG